MIIIVCVMRICYWNWRIDKNGNMEKEYAEELVYFFEMQTYEQMTHNNAKECALKVVQEIKKHNERFNFSSYNLEESVNSLLLVEKEIEKL